MKLVEQPDNGGYTRERYLADLENDPTLTNDMMRRNRIALTRDHRGLRWLLDCENLVLQEKDGSFVLVHEPKVKDADAGPGRAIRLKSGGKQQRTFRKWMAKHWKFVDEMDMDSHTAVNLMPFAVSSDEFYDWLQAIAAASSEQEGSAL